MLVSTNENLLLLFDAMTGEALKKLTEYPNEGSNLEACFTPDSLYLISGDEKGKIHVWKTAGEQEEVGVLDEHFMPVQCL